MKFHKLLSLIAASLCALVASAQQHTPRYIFYFIGDGMGLNPVMAAQAYNRDILHNPEPLLMMQFPVASWAMTYSASAPITDSAAAGTALATGYKTRNGMVGMTPDSVAVTSIARKYKDAGFGVGVITSVGADDATPAAFYAHAPYRKQYYDIDREAVESGYEIIAGAGMAGMKDKDGRPTDIAELLEANGVQLVWGADGINDITADRVVHLADSVRTWNIGYTIDSIPGALTLPQMTRAAIKQLRRVTPERFFLMVEGGNIDHALHANDGGAAIKEILNFNEALAEAYQFYLKNPDETLIVVTADHDTGGMSHVHSKTSQSYPLGIFDSQKVSKEAFSEYCKSLLNASDSYSWDDMRDYLTANLGLFERVKVKPEDEERLRKSFSDTFDLRNTADQKTLYASFNSFAVDVFRLLNEGAGTVFTSVGHSGNLVPVFAIGAGSDEFRHPNNNIDIPRIIARLSALQ